MENANFSWKDTGICSLKSDNILSDSSKKSTNGIFISKSVKGSIDGSELQNNSCNLSFDVKLSKHTTALKNISISISEGELWGVIGPVGSGKSSLCHAILGEMHKISGILNVNVNTNSFKNQNDDPMHSNSKSQFPKKTQLVAYASQSPWIFGGTVKENILFGNTYEESWFNTVVNACTLDKDFIAFEKRENTLIGEKGATLSGGQKARVALARAIYTRANVYLLDDPLSAVDPKVARHLFDHVIKGLLKKKTVILVTHQLQLVYGCDKIILLEDGCIAECGLPNSISKLDKHILNDTRKDEFKNTKKLSDNSDVGEVFQNYEEFNVIKKQNIDTKPDCSEMKRENSFSEKILSIEGGLDSHQIPLDVLSFTEQENYGANILENNENLKIGNEESMEKNRMGLNMYIKFFNFGSSYIILSLSLLLVFAMQGVTIYADYYLSAWSSLPLEKKESDKKVLVYFILNTTSFFEWSISGYG
ncbi:Multidrug resistance-associated protein 4 [Smittium mucronatum]|uniref:Multidrug resistance-associated protein 4 n=1 Tax=Smittium mucronatum TaxID=133383 RepID=A0A1R0H1C7_9FUNG|nr:Multidrug resistance-associated protein 4 [Smittium mucronatum]